MKSMQVTDRITAEEYLAFEGERRTWLVDGTIVVNEPRLPHAALSMRLIRALDQWTCAAADRGFLTIPIDVQLDDHNVYAPDLLWYRAGRVPAIDAEPPYPLPDLAVEIRSPSTWRYDIGTKKSVYEREGLPELWLVDGDASVLLVFRRSGPTSPAFDVALELDRGATLTSPLLPGFALDVGALFAFD
jgi:Uma2 family endonuclease